MANNIKISIDVTKITKKKLFVGKKREDGKTAQYLNAVLVETPNGQYGDFMIVEEVSKEEREAGVKGPILGNGKFFGFKAGGSQPTQVEDSGDDDQSGDDTPF